MLQLALALTLAVDAGTPLTEAEAQDKILERAHRQACAPDAGMATLCTRVTAFQAASPAKAQPPIFTLGSFEELALKGGGRGAQLQLLDISAAGVTVGVVKPDDEAEREHFLSIIEALGRGERKDPLLLAVAKDARQLPHFPTSIREGSLMFQIPALMGGHWLRSAPGKLYMLSFNGDTHRPAIRLSEFPDDRK